MLVHNTIIYYVRMKTKKQKMLGKPAVTLMLTLKKMATFI